jgi:hypothetical protein
MNEWIEDWQDIETGERSLLSWESRTAVVVVVSICTRAVRDDSIRGSHDTQSMSDVFNLNTR